MSGKFHCVDLKDHFCHKLVYRELPEKGGFGLDDICILRSNYFKGEKVVLNRSYKNEFLQFIKERRMQK